MSPELIRRLRKYADLMAYVLLVSNKNRGIRVAIRYRKFLERLERPPRDAV